MTALFMYLGYSVSLLHIPERKDRTENGYGGVIVYLKDTLHYIRRFDLEPKGVECIWIELMPSHCQRILFAVFYRPPNSDANYTNLKEYSISLATDTGISDTIILSDFNFNQSNPQMSRKITSICQQFRLEQLISEPTHFTESSCSLLDLIFVSCGHRVIASSVGEPVLNQNQRFHCPTYYLFSRSHTETHLNDLFGYTTKANILL